MSTMLEAEVTAARNHTPWAAIKLAEMMKDLAGEHTDATPGVSLECVYRHSVSSRFWWSLRWIGADGQRYVADAQTLDLCLWRAAVREQKTRAQLDSSNKLTEPVAGSGWLPCPFCGAAVKLATTEESFRHAGSVHWRTTIRTDCGCFDEAWSRGNYGTQESVSSDARRVWNTRPNN